VGQDEEPATPMACARLSRREDADLWREAHCDQVVDDVGQSQIDVAFHVLKEDPLGPDLSDDPGDVGPEVPRILGSAPQPGQTEGLAGIAGRDEMNAATPWAAVEGSKVAPDRRFTQGLVRHPGHESGRGVTFPLDETHSSVMGLGDVQTEVEACVAGAEREPSEVVELRNEVGM
jgi:hypothetical protein